MSWEAKFQKFSSTTDIEMIQYWILSCLCNLDEPEHCNNWTLFLLFVMMTIYQNHTYLNIWNQFKMGKSMINTLHAVNNNYCVLTSLPLWVVLPVMIDIYVYNIVITLSLWFQTCVFRAINNVGTFNHIVQKYALWNMGNCPFWEHCSFLWQVCPSQSVIFSMFQIHFYTFIKKCQFSVLYNIFTGM